MRKYIIILAIGLVFYWAGKEDNNKEATSATDLEIYTKDNIYYINGLTLANEVDNKVIQFNSKEELKEYISNLTAKQ